MLALIATHDLQHQLSTLLLDYASRLRSLHHTTQDCHARLQHVGHCDAAISPALASTSHSLLKVHQAPQCRQLGRIEGLRHQVRDHQLGSNVLRRDDTASSEIAQVLVPHFDVLGFYRESFSFDLTDGCLIIHVN